jgi:hypothetical protein
MTSLVRNSIYRYSIVGLQLDNSISEAEQILKQKNITHKMYSIKEFPSFSPNVDIKSFLIASIPSKS